MSIMLLLRLSANLVPNLRINTRLRILHNVLNPFFGTVRLINWAIPGP